MQVAGIFQANVAMAAERQIRWATVLEQRGWAGRDTYTLSRVGFFETLWTVAHQAPLHGILQARILERVAIPFSRGSSWPRDQTQVSYIAGRFFTIWATREAQELGEELATWSPSSSPRLQSISTEACKWRTQPCAGSFVELMPQNVRK